MSKIFIVALDMEKVSEPKGSDNKYHAMSELAVNWCLLHELIFTEERASEREVWPVHWGAEVGVSDGAGSEVSASNSGPRASLPTRDKGLVNTCWRSSFYKWDIETWKHCLVLREEVEDSVKSQHHLRKNLGWAQDSETGGILWKPERLQLWEKEGTQPGERHQLSGNGEVLPSSGRAGCTARGQEWGAGRTICELTWILMENWNGVQVETKPVRSELPLPHWWS